VLTRGQAMSSVSPEVGFYQSAFSQISKNSINFKTGILLLCL